MKQDIGRAQCGCEKTNHKPKLIVLTGGPGAGKTAVLEIARRNFCKHVVILPEAASVLFGGGFWRHDSVIGKRAAQRAIFHLQREAERLAIEENQAAIILCDRGTLDGLAYWPGEQERFWKETQTTQELELERYNVLIHLRTPDASGGYNHQNKLRIETAAEALEIDRKIFTAWEKHPHRFVIGNTQEFFEKAVQVIRVIGDELPGCCLK